MQISAGICKVSADLYTWLQSNYIGLFQYFEDCSSNGGSPVGGSPMDPILELNKQQTFANFLIYNPQWRITSLNDYCRNGGSPMDPILELNKQK